VNATSPSLKRLPQAGGPSVQTHHRVIGK